MEQVRCVESECISILRKASRMLESRGFRVSCNGKARGASGSYWDVSCIGELSLGPLKIRLGLAAVAGVGTDTVEYYYSAKNDLALDKIIVVSKAKPPEELEKLASRLGIAIISGEELAEGETRSEGRLKPLYIHPRLSLDEVVDRVNTGKIRGIKPAIPILGKRRSILGARLLLYPLLCYKGTAHAHLGEEGTIATRDVDLCFEGGSGSLVAYEDRGLAVVWEWGQLGEIDDTAVDVLEVIGEIGTVSLSQLKEHFKDLDVELTLNVLEEYGLIERLGGDMYTIAKPPIEDYKSPMLELAGSIKETPPLLPCTRQLDPMADSIKLRRIVESIGTVEEEALVYYPIYMVVVREEKSDIKLTILVDGTTGSRLDDLEEVISDSTMVKAIDRIVEDIEKSPRCGSEPAQPPHSPSAQPG